MIINLAANYSKQVISTRRFNQILEEVTMNDGIVI